jgi:hypothetical protein
LKVQLINLLLFIFGPFFWIKCGEHLQYKGRWKHGRFNGCGHIKYSNGSSHSGLFCNGIKHGFGTFISSSGFKYSGDWQRGRQVGNACVCYKNGDVYHGEIVDGYRVGKGELFCLASNRTYSGVWQKGNLIGECKIVDPHWLFEGNFHSFTGIGIGKLLYSNGDIYQGEIFNFKRSGFGKLILASGKKITGKWTDLANVSQAKMDYGGGITLEGNIINFEPDGLIRITFPNGQTYTGLWEDGNLLRALSSKFRSGRKPTYILR